jgi:transposase-like protein
LITSGSSFCFVAATVSYKPVVLFDRPKEGLFFGVYMDADYVRLDGGSIVEQSLSEVRRGDCLEI